MINYVLTLNNMLTYIKMKTLTFLGFLAGFSSTSSSFNLLKSESTSSSSSGSSSGLAYKVKKILSNQKKYTKGTRKKHIEYSFHLQSISFTKKKLTSFLLMKSSISSIASLSARDLTELINLSLYSK